MIHIITSRKHRAMPTMLLSTSLWHAFLWVILGLSGLSSPTSICRRKKSPQLEIAFLYLSVFASPPLYEFLMHLNVGLFSKKSAVYRKKQTNKKRLGSENSEVLSPRIGVLHSLCPLIQKVTCSSKWNNFLMQIDFFYGSGQHWNWTDDYLLCEFFP